jgi:hypothetical protein
MEFFQGGRTSTLRFTPNLEDQAFYVRVIACLEGSSIKLSQPRFHFASSLSPLLKPQALFPLLHLYYLGCDVLYCFEMQLPNK